MENVICLKGRTDFFSCCEGQKLGVGGIEGWVS